MVEIITDSQTITIGIIQHANCVIENLVYPANVESGETFNITYDVKNNGADDTCYGKLYNAAGNIDTWQETINAGSTVSKTVTFPSGITDAFSGTLEVGYIK